MTTTLRCILSAPALIVCAFTAPATALLAEGLLAIGTHRFTLDGSDLPAGIYLVRAESGERRLTERITLVR